MTSKVCVSDVYCKSSTGDEFIVEMQLSSQLAFVNQVVLYALKTFTNQLERGVSYESLKRLYMIVICDFNVLPDCSWYSHHKMINVSKLQEMMGMPLTKDMIQCDFQVYTFVVLQLPNFEKICHPTCRIYSSGCFSLK